MTIDIQIDELSRRKFVDPDWTAKGERRAVVPFDRLETLWINTGTLCNITCRNCYIESSPSNDRLEYITTGEAVAFLDEARAMGGREIGFTGGEPFLNPDFLDMLRAALERVFNVLVLTNAMQPMQRPHIRDGLLSLLPDFRAALVVRVSLDHFTQAGHEAERGVGSWQKTIDGIDWLVANGFRVALAGRAAFTDTEETARQGYGALVAAHGWPIDSAARDQLVLLPEMETGFDGPEITTRCWDILKKKPSDMMCAWTRMVVKRKGASAPVVLPCTLLPYDPKFEMGATLQASTTITGPMFDQGSVKLCHQHCAKFCVLGGGSCS